MTEKDLLAARRNIVQKLTRARPRKGMLRPLVKFDLPNYPTDNVCTNVMTSKLQKIAK